MMRASCCAATRPSLSPSPVNGSRKPAASPRRKTPRPPTREGRTQNGPAPRAGRAGPAYPSRGGRAQAVGADDVAGVQRPRGGQGADAVAPDIDGLDGATEASVDARCRGCVVGEQLVEPHAAHRPPRPALREM